MLLLFFLLFLSRPFLYVFLFILHSIFYLSKAVERLPKAHTPFNILARERFYHSFYYVLPWLRINF